MNNRVSPRANPKQLLAEANRKPLTRTPAHLATAKCPSS